MMEKTRSILLIEDNPGDACLVQEALKGMTPTFHLECVDRLAAGLEHLAKARADLILLDLTLPDSQGLATLAAVRKHVPGIPVVILTGWGDEAVGVRAVGEGAQDCLMKGQMNDGQLRRAIEYAIRRHQRLMGLHAASFADPLTGVYNRRAFLTLARQQLRIAERGQRDLTLIWAEADQVQPIRQSFGQAVGDRALCAAAKILRQTFRSSDVLARWGEGEFVVLAIDAASAWSCTHRLENNLKRFNAQKSLPCPLSLGVGSARFRPQHKLSIEALLAEARVALYERARRRQRRPDLVEA